MQSILNYLLKNNNKDIIIYILDMMDYETVLSIYQTNKQFNEICKSVRAEWMWRNKVLRMFGEKAILFKSKRIGKQTWREYLVDLKYLIENFTDSKAMFKAAKKGSVELVEFFLDRDDESCLYGIKYAAKGGNKDMIQFFIDKEAYYTQQRVKNYPTDMKINKSILDQCLGDAIYGAKDMETVDFLINKYRENLQITDIDWRSGLLGAYKKGNEQLIDFFLEKLNGKNDNSNIRWAARGGHTDIVQSFIKRGVDDSQGVMLEAAEGGYMNLVVEFAEKLYNEYRKRCNLDLIKYSWEKGLCSAAKGGYKEIVQFFIDKGAHDWDEALHSAARGGHIELVEFFIDKGSRDFEIAVSWAATGGYKKIIKFLEDKICTL